VVVPQIFVTKESFRKIRIQVYDPTIATQEAEEGISSLAVFPNPTNGMLYFKNEFEAARVFDLNGKIVMEKQYQGETGLDVSSLPNGLYFLEITENLGTRRIGRFVKN